MNQEIIDQLYAELRKDRSTKYRNIGICSIILGLIVGVYIFFRPDQWSFILLTLIMFGVGIFAFFSAKKFDQTYPIESINFVRRTVIGKTYDRNTSGRTGHLLFEGGYDYPVHPLRGRLYDKTNIGDSFYLAILKRNGEVLVAQLAEATDNPIIVQRGQQVPRAHKPENNFGLNPTMRSMLNGDDAPIIVCDLVHKVQFANSAARKYYDQKNMTAITLFEMYPPETVVEIQKALTQFSTDEALETADVVYEDRTLRLCALRNESGELNGYSVKMI